MSHESIDIEARDATVIIIPAYNEAESIAAVVDGLTPNFPRVLVVDDGSTDATADRARRAGAPVLRHVLNRGQGAALQTGITAALRDGARYLVTFDADGQHQPADIPALLAPIIAGQCDVVLGSRFLGRAPGMTTSRRAVLRAGVLFTRLFSRIAVTDTHNGLRAFSRRAAEQLEITMDRMAHASEVIDQIARLRLRWCEAPVTIRYTDYSRAKGQSSRRAFRVALHYLLRRMMP